MPNLDFTIDAVRALPDAATPQIGMRLGIRNRPAGESIHSIALQCRIDIEPARRRYQPREQEAMSELFGAPERWGTTLRRLPWAELQVHVPAFSDATTVELRVPCSFDFNLAATRYFHGLEAGEIPAAAVFSGSVFYADESGRLQVARVAWDSEASTLVPAAIWRELMNMHYPEAGWLWLRWDAFDRLCRYRRERGLPNWEQTIEHMLAAAGEGSRA